MCGIIGVASTEGMKNRLSRLQFMKMGLDIDSWRGWESTGLALVPEASKDAPIVYKRALNGRDFIQLNQVEKYLSDIEKYSVAIGHNRAATTGRGNIVDHNAHPFQYGRITLVHNGHIRNTQDLKGAQQGANCLVDSSHVAFSMNANGEKETLELCDGGFVFVWWNSETSTLNIARNKERPLHMAFANKENTFYWASELTELLHLLKDVDVDEDMGILYPEPGNWYQFNLKDLREFTKTPFVKCQGRRTQGMYSNGTGRSVGGMEQDRVPWRTQEGSDTTSTTSTRWGRTTNSTGTMSDAEELDAIRQDLSNQRLKEAKQSGVPTSEKRVRQAKQKLGKMGFQFYEMRNCDPISWCKYVNQDNLGSVLAKTKKEGRIVEVTAVRHDDFLEYSKVNNLLVDLVNVRNGPNNDIRIVGVVSPRMKRYLENVRRNVPAKKLEESLGSIDRDYVGPDGTKITRARFCELSIHGCANCKVDVEPAHHEQIIWVGSPPMALCPECSKDPGTLELLGIPPEYRIQQVH